MHSRSMTRTGMLAIVATSALALAACSKETKTETETASTPTEVNSTTTTTTTTTGPAAPAAAPAADNTDTISGVKYASYTGDAAKGAVAFATCKTCHDAKINKIGPHLDGVVGRKAGSLPDFNYTPANKNSGITWSPEKLFQYLENPQRVVPGTKMTFVGFPDPQKRADVIAYLQTLK